AECLTSIDTIFYARVKEVFLSAIMRKVSRQKPTRPNKKINVVALIIVVICLPVIVIAANQQQQIKQDAAGLASNAVTVSPQVSVSPSGSPQTLTCADCMKKNPNSSLCLTESGKSSFCQDNATGNPS